MQRHNLHFRASQTRIVSTSGKLMNTKRTVPAFSTVGAALGSLIAWVAFERITSILTLAAIAGAMLGALAMFGLSRIRRQGYSMGAAVAFLCAASMTVCVSARDATAQEGVLASSAAMPNPHSPTGVASLPIFYDHALAAQGFSNPLLRGRIAGNEATFIIDTGASANVLADWFVKAAGISTSRIDSQARDNAGKAAPERLVQHLQGQWSDGQRFELKEAAVIPFPAYFRSLHIGGLISPQLLAPVGMAAVLDLRAPSLQFVPFERALSNLQRAEAPLAPVDLTPSCRNEQSKFVNRQYVTPVTVAGVTELMLVDTGATSTIFSDKSRIARAVGRGSERARPSEGVGGEKRGERRVRDVHLLRGGQSVTVNASVGEVSASCGRKGVLGMDALRSCVLILGDKQIALSCAAE